MNEINQGSEKFIDPANLNVSRVYCNNFTLGWSASDIYMIGLLNGNPNLILNMSYTTAKTLRDGLNQLIDEFERRAEMEIKTIDFIATNINKNSSGNQ